METTIPKARLRSRSPPPSENRRSRRRREKRKSANRSSGMNTPVEDGSATKRLRGDAPTNGSEESFRDGNDFIPFGFSDNSDEEFEAPKATPHAGPEVDGKNKETSPKNRETDEPAQREWDKGKIPQPQNKRTHETAFDANDGYTSKKQRVDASSRKSPWMDGLAWEQCNNVAEMLHLEVDAFVNWISPTPVEDEIRGLIVTLISKCVKDAFPDSQVLPFGSYQTKLYLPLGDIDLVILSESMAYSNKVNVLHALANCLKRSGITSRVTVIAKAKVPIVKFVTDHGRFNVDISVNQENGIRSGNIIKGFMSDMIHHSGTNGSTALRSLVMIVKSFLSQRSMNEVYTGGLGSYSIVCLAVSFLQMHPKIRRGEINAEKNLGVLVMEFFELYGCYFNYEEVGISVRDGGTYFNKKRRGWYDQYKSSLLSIEDPADPSNDISRVRTTFAGAYGILTATAYLRAGMITARREGRSMRLRQEYSQDDMSILSSIMGITQETINHRKLVQEVYDKRTLHNILGLTVPVILDDTHKAPLASSSSRGTQSVQAAWREAEADGHSDHESHDDRHRSRRFDEMDGGGRYNINKRSRKRRRAARYDDDYEVYPTTDDEDHPRRPRTTPNGISETEDGEYLSDGTIDSRTDRRRSYWLSKGFNGTESD
ncbi:hypothetical protein BD779DRAFT_1535701 [Infundibulicybe gibba]|nr:hypothetical protein BD779DRAFT_1535701 [Infundibulicybe gibba]